MFMCVGQPGRRCFCPGLIFLFLFPSREKEKLIFFFSSRPRHTRLVSDWSLDVCSSDLLRFSLERAKATSAATTMTVRTIAQRPDRRRRRACPCFSRALTCWGLSGRVRGLPDQDLRRRSEERRVGKECRCRWTPYR